MSAILAVAITVIFTALAGGVFSFISLLLSIPLAGVR
jgi:hypothetical protein